MVVGSGPNGLAAAITLQQAGLRVFLAEGKKEIGGGLRTAELTLPGFQHDICSAIHPMALASPFFSTLPLQQFGLDFIIPANAAAHPFDDGSAAILTNSLQQTAALLGKDELVYLKLMSPVVKNWSSLKQDLLAPLRWPKRPVALANFGLKGLQPAASLAGTFKTPQAKALWAGMAAHAIQPLTNLATSAIGLVLSAAAHTGGWPVPKGGSQSIANALAAYFVSIGGTIHTNFYVSSLNQLPSSSAVLFDVTPAQLLKIAGNNFSAFYQWQLRRYRYGMGVFKVDWALNAPIPFTNKDSRSAGTVHLGNTIDEIVTTEKESSLGKHPEKPFVLLAQPSIFDDSRAPAGKHTAWAYCHVPNGSTLDRTEAIEKQVERFAPGFRDTIIGRHSMNTQQLESYNANYVGGDINGGILDITQLFTRPALRFSPYRSSAKGLYICSSSTPPGGGVHGMCGYHAASRVLKDIFKTRPAPLPEL